MVSMEKLAQNRKKKSCKDWESGKLCSVVTKYFSKALLEESASAHF